MHAPPLPLHTLTAVFLALPLSFPCPSRPAPCRPRLHHCFPTSSPSHITCFPMSESLPLPPHLPACPSLGGLVVWVSVPRPPQPRTPPSLKAAHPLTKPCRPLQPPALWTTLWAQAHPASGPRCPSLSRPPATPATTRLTCLQGCALSGGLGCELGRKIVS